MTPAEWNAHNFRIAKDNAMVAMYNYRTFGWESALNRAIEYTNEALKRYKLMKEQS